jgi:hypothetical protein
MGVSGVMYREVKKKGGLPLAHMGYQFFSASPSSEAWSGIDLGHTGDVFTAAGDAHNGSDLTVCYRGGGGE